MVTIEQFKYEVLCWSEKIGFEANEIWVRKRNDKLASSSSRGRLTFNVSVLKLPEDQRSEVILKALLNLKYPDNNDLVDRSLEIFLNE